MTQIDAGLKFLYHVIFQAQGDTLITTLSIFQGLQYCTSFVTPNADSQQ